MSHVLFISHARGIHGAEAVMVQAVKACAAKGVWVTVVVPSIVPDEGLNEALQGIFGVDVIELPYRAAGRHKLRTYAVLFYNLRAAMYLLKYVRDKHVSTIYSSSSITFLGGLVADTAEIRHVWHWHEPVDKRFGWHPSMKGFYRAMVQRTSHLVCISRQQQQEWEQTLQIALPDVTIIYNPIKRIEVSQPVAHEGIRFGFIGHFEERKNLPLLVLSFEQLHAVHPNTSLWLCGAIGEKDKVYVEQMTALREPDIRILPQTPDVASFYAQIDVLVLPSWRETMPLVVLEAMQAGVCVLQTDQSGMKERIEDGKESLFFSPYEPESLLQLMEQCMDQKERTNIATAGQKKAMDLVNNQSFDNQITKLICE